METFDGDAKCDVITLRVTEAEKKTIQTLASNSKLNVAQLIRELIFSSGLLSKNIYP